MSYDYFPRGGDLVVQTTPGSGYPSSTPNRQNGTTENSSNKSVSKGAFAGGVVGTAIGGFILGILALYGYYKLR
jgi:hypothetical protein